MDADNSERLIIQNNITSISQESARSKMDSSNSKHIQNQHNGGIHTTETGFTKSSSSARMKADSKVNQGHSKITGEYSGKTEKVENRDLKKQQNRRTFSNVSDNLTQNQPYTSENNTGRKLEKINGNSESRLLFSAKKLIPKSVRFHNSGIKQIRPISYNLSISTLNQKSNKNKKSLSETLHVDLECCIIV